MDRSIGSITICLPMSNLESVKSKLMSSFQREQSEEDIIIRQVLTDNIKNTTSEIKVDLGTVTLSAGDIMGLEAGDIVQLDQRKDDLLSGYIAGKHKFRGTPGIHRGNMAFLIKEQIH